MGVAGEPERVAVHPVQVLIEDRGVAVAVVAESCRPRRGLVRRGAHDPYCPHPGQRYTDSRGERTGTHEARPDRRWNTRSVRTRLARPAPIALSAEGWRNAQFGRIRLYLDASEGIALRPAVGRRLAGAMLVGVFERFTDRARRVLVLAQEEARLLGHSFIGTEHILLGLIHEGDGVAAKALEVLEIHLEAVRREVEKTVGASGQAPAGSPPFTPRAKKVLELSLREALQFGHNYIGTEHMLLGLIREGEGVAAQVLTTLGADLARVRQQVIVLLGGQASPEAIEAVGVSPEAGRDGPRCPTCRSALDGHVGYRVLGVGPVGQPETSEVIDVMFVYCLRCGVMLAHTPAGDIGLSSGAGSQAVAFAEVEQTPVALQPERVIAEGVTGDNVRWTLRAGGDEGSYSTILRVRNCWVANAN